MPPVTLGFLHDEICKKHGRNPNETTLQESACLSFGLDPEIVPDDEVERLRIALIAKKGRVAFQRANRSRH